MAVMKLRTLMIVTVLLAVASAPAFAGSGTKLGTAGGQELLIPIGSRGTAMGGAAVASPSGLEAIYWNPAGLSTLEGTEAMFSHQPYFAGIKINFFGIATAVEGVGTLALSAKVVNIGDMEQTTFQAIEGNGKIFSPTLSVIGVTYARQLTANVGLGINGSWINEKIFEVSSSGLAFDFGVTFDPKWRGLQMGIAIKNYGPDMKFSGPGFDRSYEEAGRRDLMGKAMGFSLPSHFNLGLSYPLYSQDKSSVLVAGNFQSNNFSDDHWQGGAEYSYDNKYFLRAGYNYSQQTSYLYGLSLGGGLTVPLGTTKLTFEYAWTQTDTFADNQFFTLRMNF
jgi:hypothetical protein